MTRFYLTLALALAAAACTPTSQEAASTAATDIGNDAVRAGLAQILPEGVSIQSVTPSPIPQVHEVVVDGRVVYVSADGKYLLQGALIKLATRTNLTELSEATLHRAELAKVGPERRIVFAADRPKYRVTVFTDVECGFCRQLHSQIAQYNAAGITVEYLLYPRAGVGSSAYDTSVGIWCSDDRRQALTDAKLGLPTKIGTCNNPVADNIDLGHRLGFPGTPAVYAPNGMLLGGYLPPADMLARLEQIQPSAD